MFPHTAVGVLFFTLPFLISYTTVDVLFFTMSSLNSCTQTGTCTLSLHGMMRDDIDQFIQTQKLEQENKYTRYD
jgi:hypothetical protein